MSDLSPAGKAAIEEALVAMRPHFPSCDLKPCWCGGAVKHAELRPILEALVSKVTAEAERERTVDLARQLAEITAKFCDWSVA